MLAWLDEYSVPLVIEGNQLRGLLLHAQLDVDHLGLIVVEIARAPKKEEAIALQDMLLKLPCVRLEVDQALDES